MRGHRAIGLLVLLLAVTSALVIPGLDGRQVSGAGHRAPVPPPPQVGDCALDRPGEMRSALTFSGAPILHVPTGSCDAANYGEIVSVTDSAEFPRVVAGDVVNPDPLACADPAWAHVRHSSGPARGADGDPIPWRPFSTRRVGILGPDLWQYRDGQRWLACVFYPGRAPYQGSVGSTSGAASPDAASAFSVCQTATNRGPVDVACDGPHTIELLGVTGDTRASDQALLESCRDLTASITGMADPTAGGTLAVSLRPTSSAPSVIPIAMDWARPRPHQLCQIERADGGLLTASLIGLGDRPLPLG